MARHQHSFQHALRRRFYRPFPVVDSHRCLFGWLMGILLGILIITGIMLSFYYQPSSETAYESVKYIVRDVGHGWSGWLCRGIHAWASHAVIALGVFQFMRVFLTGAYRGRGRSHWRLGLMALFLSFGFAFTGDLLAWDEAALWSADLSLEWVESVPLFGHTAASILRGGVETGTTTLRNFYAFHVLLLPAFGVLLAWFWSWLPKWSSCRRSGGAQR